ncbi:MAG: hypothetical protein K9G76_07480 [Bacteroidales bacterium]|nr:hypothetical protein [Bacteroidales bacterium]MCF8405913.1 hypothetical protein [Bacteroidales bacterium]
MKKTAILFMLFFFTIGLFAQEENKNNQEYRTLFGSENISHGGWGGLSVNYTQIGGADAILVGAKGGWLINHGVTIGIGGYGISNNLYYDKKIDDKYDEYQMAGGYGGLLIEPIIGAKWPVHVSIPILIGAGGVAYINNYWSSYDNDFNSTYTEDADAFFVLEPGIEVELNMIKFMRLSIGGYYRITSDLNLADTKPNVLDGFSVGMNLKFGKF